jgi:Cytochrome P460
MRRFLFVGTAILICFCLQHAVAAEQDLAMPHFSGEKLERPDGYREWIYLSSGLGMNYSAMPMGSELFTNVFVAPWAYREFLGTGKWPEKSIFVVEDRDSQNKGSINKTGHFQTDFEGMAVEVKDSSRFPDTWAYFGFAADTKTANANPKAACWQCHEDHAAVEHTFVQFYPTLKPVAEKFGTYRKAAEVVSDK